MTTKERKQIKHSLKTNIDSADTWVKMALAGAELGSNDPLSNDFVIDKLKKIRRLIADDANAFIAEIDKAIDRKANAFISKNLKKPGKEIQFNCISFA